MPVAKPYGSWDSPITTGRVVAASVRLGDLAVTQRHDSGEVIWWDELRPEDNGRTQVVRREFDGDPVDCLPEGFSAHSRVHEYGGGDWWVHDDWVFFVNDEDQRIWKCRPGEQPMAVSPEPATHRGARHADGIVTGDGRWVIAVLELHEGEPDHPGDRSEPVNRLVAYPADSDGADGAVVLVDGPDFVSWPRLSPGDGHLSYLSWDHPDMPWDSTQLWVGDLVVDGATPVLERVEVVAGGPGESIAQPQWDPAGRLWFTSDRTNWWNLYQFPEGGRPSGEPLAADNRPLEVGQPQWVFGHARYAFTGDGRVVFAGAAGGTDSLGIVDPVTAHVDRIEVNVTSLAAVAAGRSSAMFIGATFVAEPSVEAVLLGRGGSVGGSEVVRPARDLRVSSANFSEPQHISFPTSEGARAHGLFYPPVNGEFEGPPDERPPLIVMIHGGPTSSARPELRLALQFWTSRGFAVVDVNYRGSTGYGRVFRDELRGKWGVADVADCVAAAQFLADAGRVDPERMLIRGGSAGGFTALAALTFTDVFAGGASLYGVADLAVLASDTHKFESRYLDGLVGPWPEAADLYAQRSPLHHIADLDKPVIVLQGLEDRVVPPNQAEAIVDALAGRGVPHAYVTFPDEGHGFRKAANIEAALAAELSFYSQILGFPHPDDVDRVEVRHRRG